MKKLNEEDLKKVNGGISGYELKHTSKPECPYCYSTDFSPWFKGDNLMSCNACGYSFIYDRP